MSQYIMTLDQGTSSSRCILFNKKGEIITISQKEYTQIYPMAGWVEHDPMEIWSTQIGVAQEAMYKIGATFKDIVAIGITNQRETTIVWDKDTGKPVYNAIVWQCRRTAPICDILKEKGLEESYKEKTGLIIDPYFSATKIHWILNNVAGVKERANRGELLFGTVDTWLLWNLTKGIVHATDYSNASRTMLYNIKDLSWDMDILKELDIPVSMLPDVCPSSHIFAETDKSIFGGEIPIAGIVGDQQAALFGQTCFNVGSVKNTYGTGCFLLMNTGDTPVYSKNGLLTTIAWGLDGKITYALEGSIFVAGAAVQWLRDELHMIDTSAQSEELSNQVCDTNGVYVVPAFVGLGAPYWDAYARGAIFGLTRGANKNHIVRATLESIAYQTVDVCDAMQEDANHTIDALRCDGGACDNKFLMSFQADIINISVDVSYCKETTALGAAYLAGLAVGYWANLEDIKKNFRIEKTFLPNMDEKMRAEKLYSWKKAVAAARMWGK